MPVSNTLLLTLAAVVIAACGSAVTHTPYYDSNVNSHSIRFLPIDPSHGEWTALHPLDSRLRLVRRDVPAPEMFFQKTIGVYKERWLMGGDGYLYYEQVNPGSFTHEATTLPSFWAAHMALADGVGFGTIPEGTRVEKKGRLRYATYTADGYDCTAFRQVYGLTSGRFGMVPVGGGDTVITGRFCFPNADTPAVNVEAVTFEFLSQLRQNRRRIVSFGG